MQKSIHLTSAFILLCFTWSISSTAQQINGGMSGSFYNPDQSGSGINIEILEGNVANGYWYTYDLHGFQMWLLISGTVNENSIEGDLYYFEGMKFDTLAPEDRSDFIFGKFQITYSDCNNLEFSYDPSLLDFDGTPFPVGASHMTRLTFPLGVQDQCNWEGETEVPTRSLYGGVYAGTVKSNVAGASVPASGVITEKNKLWFLTERGIYFGTIHSTETEFSSRLSAMLFIGYVFPGGNSYGYMDITGSLKNGALSGNYQTFNPDTRNVVDSGNFQLESTGVYDLGVSQADLTGSWTSVEGGEFTISPTGRIVGTDSGGCRYDGTIIPTDSRFSVASGSIMVSQCGSFSGSIDLVGVLGQDGQLTIAFAGGPIAGVTILDR